MTITLHRYGASCQISHCEVERGHAEVTGMMRRTGPGPRGNPRGLERGRPASAGNCLPAGICRGVGAGWERPLSTEISTNISSNFRGCRSYDLRGVAPSPEAEGGIREYATEMQRDQRVSRTLTSQGYAHKYATKGGLT